MSQNLITTNQNSNNNNISSTSYHRRIELKNRLERLHRNGNSVENNSSPRDESNDNEQIPRNSISTTNNFSTIQTVNLTERQNQSFIGENNNIIFNYKKIKPKNLFTQNLFMPILKRQGSKKKPKIEEEEKKKEEISAEENIGLEIKDTVKCYICFEKITKPKMCPRCHRIACEKCLHNWFVNLKKDKCGFCREKTNFSQMIPVPFMDAIVNFVEKYFNKKTKLSDTIDKEFLEYCPEHKQEMLYYYCLDCGKPYCKTCFVFFGEEKDKHNGHSIIEYAKYKNMSLPLLKKNTDKLETSIQHIEENIKRYLAYKNVYEHERIIGNQFINNLQDEFNQRMDSIINEIDDQIKKLKEYINDYEKYKKEVENFYGSIKNKNGNYDKSCESLIIKLTQINQHKLFSSKEIEKLNDLSKNMYVNTYQSKLGEFNHENMFLSKGLKLGMSPYEIVIDNKQRNEVLISLIIPKDKNSLGHKFKSIIFLKKKGEGIKSYELNEFKGDENNYYLKKKIPWDYFGPSIFKLKGILYDYYFS